MLAYADGATSVEVAELVGCHKATAGKWRNRFADEILGSIGRYAGAVLQAAGPDQ